MAEFIVWGIIYLIFCGIVLVVRYWYELISTRNSYTREELVDLIRIIPEQLSRLTSRGGESVLSYLAIGSGVFVAWFLVLLGGLLSPDTTPSPDHASAHVTNYFFQSVLFPGILHLVWPSIKDVVMDNAGEDSLPFRFFSAEVPFFFGLACALGAVNLTVWGYYHEMSFLFCLINLVLCLVYAGFRVHTLEADDEFVDRYKEPASDYPDDIRGE